MKFLSSLVIRFDPNLPDESLAGSSHIIQVFEGDKDHSHPTNAKILSPNDDVVSWKFGRSLTLCDFIFDKSYISNIHFEIFYDRSLDSFGVFDGGYYKKEIKDKRDGSVLKNPGYSPSSLGTWLNGSKLDFEIKDDGVKPLKQIVHKQDRIYAGGFKLLISDTLHDTDLPYVWEGDWDVPLPKIGTPMPPKAEKDLLNQPLPSNNTSSKPTTMWDSINRGMDKLEKASTARLLVYLLMLILTCVLIILLAELGIIPGS